MFHLVLKVNGSYTDPEDKVYIRLLQDSLFQLKGDGQELRLTDISEEDAGWYTWFATNQFDSLIFKGYLEVTQPVAEI